MASNELAEVLNELILSVRQLKEQFSDLSGRIAPIEQTAFDVEQFKAAAAHAQDLARDAQAEAEAHKNEAALEREKTWKRAQDLGAKTAIVQRGKDGQVTGMAVLDGYVPAE